MIMTVSRMMMVKTTYPADLYCLNAFLLVLVSSLSNEFFFDGFCFCFFFLNFFPPNNNASNRTC